MCTSWDIGNQAFRDCSALSSVTLPAYFDKGTVDPTPCAPGYFMPVMGAATAESCIPCSPGSSQSTSGAVRCDDCPAGTFADQLHSTGCTDCPAGSFCPDEGTVQPLECAAGDHQNQTGQKECIQCAAGRFQPERGQVFCISCEPGGYCDAAEKRGGGFTPCREGTYNEETGRSSPDACQKCPSGEKRWSS